MIVTNSFSKCRECGMLVNDGEYHPYAACLMFKSCGDISVVSANLDSVVNHGYQAHIEETQRGAVPHKET